jgi:hypothetical protein
MEALQTLMMLIDNEKENISSNTYLECCNNLQKLRKQCYIKHNQIKNIDTKAKNMYIKQLENLKLSSEEKSLIIKQFCNTYCLNYNVGIKNFELQLKEDLKDYGPIVYQIFKEEFKTFYNTRRAILLKTKEDILIQRIAMFS